MRSVNDLKASVLWYKSPNRGPTFLICNYVPDAKSKTVMCRCALWMLIFLSFFYSSFNSSLATGVGSVLSLDGNEDEVLVEPSQSLVMTDVLTIEAWMYPLGPGSGGAGEGIIVNKEGEYELARFGDGSIRFAVTTVTFGTPDWDWINTGYVVPEGTWAHLALTYSASTNLFQLFANGVQVFSSRTGTEKIGDRWPTYNDFKIGARITHDQHFDGLIDEVRVWNIVRTEAEIRATMNTSLQGNEPGLAGYWNFDDGTANDLSQNRNHGTLIKNTEIVTRDLAKLFFSTIDLVNAGDTFALDLMVENITDLAGWQVDIAFNPEVLRAVSITEGNFFFKGWRQHLLSGRGDR